MGIAFIIVCLLGIASFMMVCFGVASNRYETLVQASVLVTRMSYRHKRQVEEHGENSEEAKAASDDLGYAINKLEALLWRRL